MALSIRLAQVVRVYPKYRSCEVVFLDDGLRCTNVHFLSSSVSSNSGGWTQHNMARPPSEDEAGGYHPDPAARTVIAVVAMVDDRPLILGYMPEAFSQLAFIQAEQNRDIWRHPSGTVVTINRNGSFEASHSGGGFVRFGAQVDSPTDPDRHEDLTPLCWNENWELPENDPPTFTIALGNREGEACKVRVRPSGDTDIMSSGNLTISYAKNVTVNVGGDAEVNTLGATSVNSTGDARVRTLADLYAVAAGDGHFLAIGEGNACSAGRMLVGSLTELVLEAPIITMNAGTWTANAAEAAFNAGSMSTRAGSVSFAAGEFSAAAGTVSFTAGELLAAAGTMGLGAAGILAVTDLFNVTGAILEEGVEGPGTLAGAAATLAAAAATTSGAAGATSGAAAAEPGNVASEMVLAGQEIAAATAELAQAAEDIILAVEEAVETSGEAVGIGPMDNLGGTVPGDSSAGDEDDVVE